MKIGMLFPDYGSQYVGMIKELYDKSRLVQEYFEEASNCLSINFVKLCFASSESELADIANAYPAIFLVSGALAASVIAKGVLPHVVAGCGIGEYAAAHTVGSISLPDGLYFLTKYASFFRDFLADHRMGALAVDNLAVRIVKKNCKQNNEQLEESAFIAIYYGSESCVVVAGQEVLPHLKNICKRQGATVAEGYVQRGLHHKNMQAVAQNLNMYLEKIDFHEARVPLIAGVDGKLITKARDIRVRIIKQITNPIRWDYVMENMKDCDIIIEVGPGTSLQKVISAIYPTKKYFSINNEGDIDALQAYVSSSTSTTQMSSDAAKEDDIN